jgi:serine/threonine protein kinase
MTDLVGHSLGPFELVEVEQRRRTATTYRARSAGRTHLVTVLPYVADPAVLAALSDEARRLARLSHPNIAAIQSTGQQDGYVYLVSEYAGPRRTLADLARPIPPDMAVGLIVPLLFALEHAHSIGVIHRDITPRRVVLPSPVWPMLTDFALGREIAGAGGSPGAVLGTPAYLAPEQAFGRPADGRTDVYSTSLVLYELLSGIVPFAADSPAESLRRQAYEPPRPLHELIDTPPALERILLRALAKDPSARPGSAAEFARGLSGALAGQTTVPMRTVGERRKLPQSQPSNVKIAEDPLESIYAAGVSAFAESRWQETVDLLSGVAEVDPDYEDVESLLKAARTAISSSAAD